MQHLAGSLFIEAEEDKKVTSAAFDLPERDSLLRMLADERVAGNDTNCEKYAAALAELRTNIKDK